MVLTLNPLLPRLWWFKKLGGFEGGLFELRDKPRFVWLVRASSAAPNFLKHRREAEGRGRGVLFSLVTSFWASKSKVTRLKAKRNTTPFDLWCANTNQFAHPTCCLNVHSCKLDWVAKGKLLQMLEKSKIMLLAPELAVTKCVRYTSTNFSLWNFRRNRKPTKPLVRWRLQLNRRLSRLTRKQRWSYACAERTSRWVCTEKYLMDWTHSSTSLHMQQIQISLAILLL